MAAVQRRISRSVIQITTKTPPAFLSGNPCVQGVPAGAQPGVEQRWAFRLRSQLSKRRPAAYLRL